MSTKKLDLSDIIVDESLQMRAGGLVEEVVSDYMAALAKLPPIRVAATKIKGVMRYYLIDGFHRYEAHRKSNAKFIMAEVTEVENLEAARILCAGMNIGHGLRRSNADKRKAVLMLIPIFANVAKYGNMTLRQKGDAAGVSHEFFRIVQEEADEARKAANRKKNAPPVVAPVATPVAPVVAAPVAAPVAAAPIVEQPARIHVGTPMEHGFETDGSPILIEKGSESVLSLIDRLQADRDYSEREFLFFLDGRNDREFRIVVSYFEPSR